MDSHVMESPTKGTVVYDGCDPDFVWNDYLEDTNSVAAPPTAFTHVEYSLESGFKVGMKLEVPSSDDGSSYWMTSVIMICGELLSLRYAGFGDDRSADFWFNVKSGELHPIGWCSANKKKLWPPKVVLEKCLDIDSLLAKELNTVDSSSPSLKEDLAASFMPIDQIKVGMKLEVIEEFNPQSIWIASIIQNVGGRLLLQYDGISGSASPSFWLFYLSDRLQPIGYGKEHSLLYSPPEGLRNVEPNWNAVLEKSFEEAKNAPFPSHIFEPRLPIEMHQFKEGMKLEAVDPANFSNICPATVSKILNDFYFTVTIDDYQTESINKKHLFCHSNTPFIFSIKWSEENNIELTVPRGYDNQEKFAWDTYLHFCQSDFAPTELFQMSCMNMGFDTGMKCEAADPFLPSEIKVATIVKIQEPLMWLNFDSEDKDKTLITSINSFDLYPVGWCASNFYPLRTPANYKPKAKTCLNPTILKGMEEEKSNLPSPLPILSEQGKSWCPTIYFNHRCFSGPLLSKSRLAELPQSIGPGSVRLVTHEVITRVVNIAYKSSQVLQILQTTGKCRPSMQQQMIKAKYKGKSYRACIETVRNAAEVEDFCKEICKKLECCPYLFGPTQIKTVCPSNCHTQTKTKFGYNFVKKQKKVGRPPLHANTSDLNQEVVKRGPGRKRKRKHWTHLLHSADKPNPDKKTKLADSSENEENSGQQGKTETDKLKHSSGSDEDVDRHSTQEFEKDNKEENQKSHSDDNILQSSETPLDTKKKFKHTPSSSIVTRGAKLPNFGLWHHVSSFHNRRGRPRTRPINPFPPIPGRKVGRPVGSTKKAIAAAHLKTKKLLENEENLNAEVVEEKKPKITIKMPELESSPNEWSVEEVMKYLQKTECAPLAPLIKDQEIDGEALLMLNQMNVQEYLHLKPEPAKKFCYLIKHLKLQFFTHFVP